MELRAERILLREFVLHDVSALHDIHSDPKLLRYYAPDVGMRKHAQMLVEMFIGWSHENPRQNFQFAIAELKTNSLIGSCGLRTKGCPFGHAEFGIGIGSNSWGKGIAREAARTILHFGFSQLDLQAVHGVAVLENEAVTKFVQRLGFEQGTPRQGDPWMTERNWSAVDWSMTRDKWKALI
jgi:RimJ/RimL family protein N-acetyltransferase